MAGLDPAIHVVQRHVSKAWMPGSSPGMTILGYSGIKCRPVFPASRGTGQPHLAAITTPQNPNNRITCEENSSRDVSLFLRK
jgi:hypothetical protein